MKKVIILIILSICLLNSAVAADLSMDQLIKQQEKILWERKISDEGFSTEIPDSFESDKSNPRIFTAIGALAGIIYFTNYLNVSNQGFGGLFGLMAIPGAGLVGGFIGFCFDEALNSWSYNNSNVGWVRSDSLGANEASLTAGAIVKNIGEAEVYDKPDGAKVIGRVDKDIYRKVFDLKQSDSGIWLKIKVQDKGLFKKDKLAEYEGWVSAKETSSIKAQAGDMVYVTENIRMRKDPNPGMDFVTWLNIGDLCLVVDIKENRDYPWHYNAFNGLWYKIKVIKIKEKT